MNHHTVLALALAPLTLAGCSDQHTPERPAVSPAAEVVGEAQSCVRLAQIQETRVRDDWTIDFVAGGDRVWRNTLTTRCPGLKSANAITYETSLSQLCNTDIVYALDTIGGQPRRGAACSLGQFVPVRLEKK